MQGSKAAQEAKESLSLEVSRPRPAYPNQPWQQLRDQASAVLRSLSPNTSMNTKGISAVGGK